MQGQKEAAAAMIRTPNGIITVSMNSTGRVDIGAARGVGGRFTVSFNGQRVLDLPLAALTAAQDLATSRNLTLPGAFNATTIGFGWAAG